MISIRAANSIVITIVRVTCQTELSGASAAGADQESGRIAGCSKIGSATFGCEGCFCTSFAAGYRSFTIVIIESVRNANYSFSIEYCSLHPTGSH